MTGEQIFYLILWFGLVNLVGFLAYFISKN